MRDSKSPVVEGRDHDETREPSIWHRMGIWGLAICYLVVGVPHSLMGIAVSCSSGCPAAWRVALDVATAVLMWPFLWFLIGLTYIDGLVR